MARRKLQREKLFFKKLLTSTNEKRGTDMAQKTKLPDNEIQKLMKQAMRGVAPREHDNHVDLALITAWQNGSQEAGLELAKQYNDVFSVIMNKPTKPPRRTRAMQKLFADPTYQDYEDLFQEILFHFLKLASQFEPEAPFSHAVNGILHQRVFNQYFSEYLETQKLETEYDDAIHGGAVEESIFLDKEIESLPAQHLELYNALNKLTSKQRQVIEMSVVKGWSAPEIAREIDMKAPAVRKHLERGMKKLKELMEVNKTEEVA
jgi:RNA polymerase sigma factor (sigma-70 family)